MYSFFGKQLTIMYQDEGRTNMSEEKKNAVELDDQALGNNELTEDNLSNVAGGTDGQDNAPIVVYGPCPFCGNSYEKLIVDTRMHSVTKYGETCTLYICDKTKKEFFASRAGFYDLSLRPM